MRAHRGLLVGWVAVAAYAALIAAVTVAALGHRDLDRSAVPEQPVAAFIAAWERSRTATFVAVGTFERRSEATGAVLASEDVVAQRPPERLHRQLGGIDGRVDDRLLVCPVGPPDSEPEPCRLGEPGGGTYAEDVDEELAGLRSLLQGDEPLYSVEVVEEGCFALTQQRIDPRAPFGVAARFCFDPATGAPSARHVTFEGGITETLVVTDIRTDVVDADLRP
ncbi:MAG: hypothetical protein ACSLFP_07715 [Acidimicrobiales bacterium]